MRFSVKRLRRWVLAAAVLLLAVTAGFFLYGRYRFQHAVRDLPARLGANIQQTATGFSYSQSSQGHTLFTLKASKEFQYKSGHVLLHNVDITLYGPPGSGRTDHIYGNEFDYDRAQGIAVSRGAVQIELAGMSAAGASQGSAAQAANGRGSTAIQVQTSGVTFLQKTGEASTAAPVHFELPRASGSAIGAQYNEKSGELVLDSQVHILTSENGTPVTIGAAHGTFVRAAAQAHLTGAALDSRSGHVTADEATIDFRQDGTARQVDARGHVRLTEKNGETATAATATILMNARSQPLRAELGGGITFFSGQPGETMHGSAHEGTLSFAASGAGGGPELQTAEFRGNVSFTQAIPGKPATERELHSQKLDIAFAQQGAEHAVEARQAIATGSPVLTMTQPQTTTRMSADKLVAALGPGNVLREVSGTGNTEIAEQSANGANETSRGDVLQAAFAQQRKRTGKRDHDAAGNAVLETATQDGHVMLTETPAQRPGGAPPQPLTAWAQHAEYRAADQVLTLTGKPRLRQGDALDMSAETIRYHRDSGDASAAGDVQATYRQMAEGSAPMMGGKGPVHIVAERANLDRSQAKGGSQAEFYGTAQARARMWQGPDQLLAPVIQLDQEQQVLRAWGSKTSPQVEANFVSAADRGRQAMPLRVRSESLVYSGKTREALFHGSVTAVSGENTMFADEARVVLKPAPEGKTSKGQGGSEIDRMAAAGRVIFTQPGRKGEGTKLVYTADDGKYVLTGTPQEPARLWDRDHGTTTGAALIFNTRNDSVEVSGGKSSAVTVTSAPG